jgi:hypothetical protein
MAQASKDWGGKWAEWREAGAVGDFPACGQPRRLPASCAPN